MATKHGARRATWAMRGKLHSPGHPPGWQRGQLERFWRQVARGARTEEAATAAGVPAPSAPGGPARLAGCARSASLPPPAVTSRSQDVRRSRSSGLAVRGCGRSPGTSAAHRRGPQDSCAPTRPRVRALRATGRRSPTGTRSAAGSARRKPGSPTTRGSAPRSPTVFQASSPGLTARRPKVTPFVPRPPLGRARTGDGP